MATPILKVITEYCDIYVNDENLQELALENKPLYARRMWGYLRVAISHFTIPSKMPLYLMGTPENPKLIEPIYGSFQYTIPEDLTSDFVLQLDDNGKGYELFSCKKVTFDDFDNVVLLPMGDFKTEVKKDEDGKKYYIITVGIVTYNSKDGTVTFHATIDNPIQKGTIFDMDFYTDGYFIENLTFEIMNILGLCFQVVWETRFINDWLSNVSKIEDKSFYEQNRANKIRADNERLALLDTKLAEAMRRYEQNLMQRKMFPYGGLI